MWVTFEFSCGSSRVTPRKQSTGMAVVIPAILGAAVKAAAGLIGSKFAVVPFLLASMAYFNYDLFDPENQPVCLSLQYN